MGIEGAVALPRIFAPLPAPANPSLIALGPVGAPATPRPLGSTAAEIGKSDTEVRGGEVKTPPLEKDPRPRTPPRYEALALPLPLTLVSYVSPWKCAAGPAGAVGGAIILVAL